MKLKVSPLSHTLPNTITAKIDGDLKLLERECSKIEMNIKKKKLHYKPLGM